MIPFSHEVLQSELDSIRKAIADLLGLSGDQLVSGIVSAFVESEIPSQLSVVWDPDMARLQVTPGQAVVPSGTAVNLDGSISDLLWTEDKRLYLVIQADYDSENAVDLFWKTQVSITTPNAFVKLIGESTYLEADKTNLIVLAVLTRYNDTYDADTTRVYFDENRPNFTVLDVKHRSLKGPNPKNFNPHGVELNDLDVGGLTLLDQTMSKGYVIPLETDFGIPGSAWSQTFTDFSFDSIGRHVDPGSYYVMLPSIPVSLPLVVDQDGAAVDYSWNPGNSFIQFGTTRPDSVTITWSSVRDLEVVPKNAYSDQLDVRGIADGPVVADGKTVKSDRLVFDFGSYDGCSLDIDVGINGAGKPVFVPPVLDSAALASKHGMEADPIVLAARSQIAVGIVGGPTKAPIGPPLGSISVDSTNCIGTFRLMYTIISPATQEDLTFVPVARDPVTEPTMAYVAPVSAWHGSVYRGGKHLSNRYWNRIGDKIYLESRAKSDDLFSYVAPAGESARFQGRYVEVAGTRAEPSGISAEAEIEILDQVVQGDYVRVQFEHGNSPVVVTAGSQWIIGSSIAESAANLSASLNSNPLFRRRAVASSSGPLVSVTVSNPGVSGNAYNIEAFSDSGNKFDVTSFSGGGAYTPNKYDLTGLKFTVNQPQSNLPSSAFIRVYVTDRINTDAQTKVFYKLLDLPFGTTQIGVTSALVDSIDKAVKYDLSTKMSISLQIAGLDTNGVQISESMLLDDVDCYEPTEKTRDRMGLKFTTNVFSKLVSWTATEVKNAGSAKLLVFASPSARDSGVAQIANVSYYGGIKAVSDTRLLKPSSTSSTPVDQASAMISGIALRAFR